MRETYPPRRTSSHPPRVREILQSAADHHSVTVQEILSNSQQPLLTAARSHVTFRLLDLGFSQAAIARHLGVHHTTILYYLRRYSGRAKAATPEYHRESPDESGAWAI